MNAFRQLGLLSTSPLQIPPKSWPELLLSSILASVPVASKTQTSHLTSLVKAVIPAEMLQETIVALKWCVVFICWSIPRILFAEGIQAGLAPNSSLPADQLWSFWVTKPPRADRLLR